MAASVVSTTPRERALPAGMRRADDAGIAVREQDRRAIGGENAERDVRRLRRHRIGLRA